MTIYDGIYPQTLKSRMITSGEFVDYNIGRIRFPSFLKKNRDLLLFSHGAGGSDHPFRKTAYIIKGKHYEMDPVRSGYMTEIYLKERNTRNRIWYYRARHYKMGTTKVD